MCYTYNSEVVSFDEELNLVSIGAGVWFAWAETSEGKAAAMEKALMPQVQYLFLHGEDKRLASYLHRGVFQTLDDAIAVVSSGWDECIDQVFGCKFLTSCDFDTLLLNIIIIIIMQVYYLLTYLLTSSSLHSLFTGDRNVKI